MKKPQKRIQARKRVETRTSPKRMVVRTKSHHVNVAMGVVSATRTDRTDRMVVEQISKISIRAVGDNLKTEGGRILIKTITDLVDF
jgi:hypothetical protein